MAVMRIYWTIKSIPELAGLPPDQQRRLWREGYWQAFRHWSMWVSLAAVGLGAGIGSYLGPLSGLQVVGAALGGAIGSFPASIVSTELVRRHLRARASREGDRQT